MNSGEKILILSSDKDYIQLHKYGNVSQYNPALKKYVKHSNPELYLLEHVIKGDGGDGIPNILSPDNCFVIGERQKPITQKRMISFMNTATMSEEVLRNYKRNESLINLSLVPDRIKEQIIEKYEEVNTNNRSKLFNYFIANNLNNLMENITDF